MLKRDAALGSSKLPCLRYSPHTDVQDIPGMMQAGRVKHHMCFVFVCVCLMESLATLVKDTYKDLKSTGDWPSAGKLERSRVPGAFANTATAEELFVSEVGSAIVEEVQRAAASTASRGPKGEALAMNVENLGTTNTSAQSLDSRSHWDLSKEAVRKSWIKRESRGTGANTAAVGIPTPATLRDTLDPSVKMYPKLQRPRRQVRTQERCILRTTRTLAHG